MSHVVSPGCGDHREGTLAPLCRATRPWESAETVPFPLDTDRISYVTGAGIAMVGGATRAVRPAATERDHALHVQGGGIVHRMDNNDVTPVRVGPGLVFAEGVNVDHDGRSTASTWRAEGSGVGGPAENGVNGYAPAGMSGSLYRLDIGVAEQRPFIRP